MWVVSLITKQPGIELGSNIDIQGSEIKSSRSVVSEVGTTISVKNLFFNIPARRNFLKSDNVEFRHIVNEFFRVSLSHPEIKFIFINNGTEIYNLTNSSINCSESIAPNSWCSPSRPLISDTCCARSASNSISFFDRGGACLAITTCTVH